MPHQQTSVSVRLREMILRGDLQPGERLLESELAASLGTSRMPIRQALPALAEEGLLVPAGKRGYSVRAFTVENTWEALRLRAVLEGFAARVLTERGASASELKLLKQCLMEGDVVLASRDVNADLELKYAEMNQRFHNLVLESAKMPLLESLTNRCNLVPFTAPRSIAFSEMKNKSIADLLFYAHCQHHSIVQAIELRQADRAEFLFREHAFTQEESQALRMPTPSLSELSGGSQTEGGTS